MRKWRKLLYLYKRYGLKEISRRVCARGLKEIARGLDAGAVKAQRYSQKVSVDWVYKELSEEDQRLLARNVRFKDQHKGQRCFVIGNGPSLKTQELSPLADEITFVTNAFWKHPIVGQWQPTYYCIKDPVFFEESEGTRIFFENLNARIDTCTFFVHLFVKDTILRRKLLPPENTYYLLTQGWIYEEIYSSVDSFDLIRAIPGMPLVSQLAVTLAIYMGCSPIYLLGLDHDWLAHGGLSHYFFEGVSIDHHKARRNISYSESLEGALRVWKGYANIASLARRRGVPIINLTNGGFLDEFKRRSYEEIVCI